MKLRVKDAETGKLLNFDVDYTNVTTSSTIDGTLPEQWATEVEMAVKPKLFMQRFCVVKEDLVQKPGDKLNITKLQELTNEGDLTEDVSLEGHEEKLQTQMISFEPAERGNAVAWSRQAGAKSILDIRTDARTLLSSWAAKKIDKDIHKGIRNNIPAGQIKYGGNATSIWDIDAADVVTPDLISKIKYIMEANDIPKFDAGDPTDPAAKNEGYYVAILHPYQIADLTKHDDYKKAAQSAAMISAMRAVGPLFQGFDAYWDGVLVYRTSLISYAVPGGGYSVKVAKGCMFGPRAIGRAVGLFKVGPGFLWNEEILDHKRKLSISVIWYDETKLLNSERIYGIYSAATDLAA